jgi:hypothetical protein
MEPPLRTTTSSSLAHLRQAALTIACVPALCALSTPAAALPVAYSSLAAFTAAAPSTVTDTFDDISTADTTPAPLVRSIGGLGYTALLPAGSAFFGAGASASTDKWLSTDIATDAIVFTNFTSSLSAIGGLFFGSDVDGAYAPGSLTVTATDSQGSTTRTIVGATDSFIGFVSTSGLLSLTVAAVQPGGDAFLWPTVDDLMLGSSAVSPVPEPSSWALMGLGLGLTAWVGRKRSRRSPSAKPAATPLVSTAL